MKKTLQSVLLGTAVLASAGVVMAEPSPFKKSQGVIDVAVFGDSPYGTSNADTSQFVAYPGFIASMNADDDLSLALHVGDIHSGKQFCSQAYDQSIYDLWKQFDLPLVYTPGDNEWTDCHKSGEGGGDPAANLSLVRSIFFSKPGRTLGEKKVILSQAKAYDPSHPSDAKYVENVMWEQSGVLFVTVNIPGGSNNDQDIWFGAAVESAAQTQERTERTAADIRWLDSAFARAASDGIKAVVIQTQADMWDLDGKTAAHLVGYEDLIADIATNVTAFGKPVLLFNGDSHIYRSDNPLVNDAPCVAEPSSGQPAIACADDDWDHHPYYNVPNFHRVVVHGSTFPLEWLKLSINPRKNHTPSATEFGPFSWKRMPQP